jgi:tetratricopeptide (TPR) repeat protein
MVFLMMMTIIPSFAEEATAPVALDAQPETESQPTETQPAGSEEAPAETEPAAEAAAEPAPAEAPAEETTAEPAPVTNTQTAAITDSQKLDAAYTLALNAITSEDYETAKEYINICFAYCDAQSDPVMFSDLLLKRACIDVIEQKNDMALLNLDAATRVKPDLADAYLVKTQVYASLGDADRAIASLEKYIELTHDTSLYETVAQLQEAKGDIKAAQAAYDKYVAGAGTDVEEAGFQAGLYKMESGDLEGAVTAFEAYRDNETYGAGAMYNIGICRMNQGNYAAAIEAFTTCEEKGGTFEGLYYNRGVCRLLSGIWKEAAEDFTKSIETEPYTADARYNLAICKMQTEDYEGAIAIFTEYIDGNKAAEGANETEQAVNYGAYYYRAVCNAALARLEEAIADYTVCIEQQYEPAQSYYQRAQIYAALGDTEKQNADLAESLKYTN